MADDEFARKYEGWNEIGRGGFASVVKTFCRDYGHDIALKIFSNLDDEQIARFRQEVHNSRLFHSRNVVKSFGASIRGALAWIELEYVDGPNLRKELERRAEHQVPFTEERAICIGIAVAEALAAGHAADVFHRDVKPANILLPRTGEVIAKLGDFGVSRFSGAAKVTRTGCSPGTPQFWAPEVCEGTPASAPSDVYSFTVCLYLLVSGNRYPYDVPEDALTSAYTNAHRHKTPIPIGVFNRGAGRDIHEIIVRGLAKDPDQRPSIKDVHDALVGARAQRATGFPVAAAPTRTTKTRDLAIAGVIGGLILAGAFALRTLPPPLGESGMLPPRTAATGEGGEQPMAQAKISPFRVGLGGVAMDITNASSQPTANLRIRLKGSSGAAYEALAAGDLAPGEGVWIPLDQFHPSPPEGLRPEAVEITADTPEGSQTTSIAFEPESKRPPKR